MLSPRNGIFQPRLSSDVYSCSNPELRTQNSGLRTQDSELRTQNSELRTQDSGLRTQDSERRAPNAERQTPSQIYCCIWSAVSLVMNISSFPSALWHFIRQPLISTIPPRR